MKKVQRIRMRVQGTALKLDGTVIYADGPTHKWFDVEFDLETLPNMRFYQYALSTSLVSTVDTQAVESTNKLKDCVFWEVL